MFCYEKIVLQDLSLPDRFLDRGEVLAKEQSSPYSIISARNNAEEPVTGNGRVQADT